MGPHPEICPLVCHPECCFRECCLRLSSLLSPGLCCPHAPYWAIALEFISSHPAPPGSKPPALVSPGPFSGLVYKNGTVPVYTSLKGVRSCYPRRGVSPFREASCLYSGWSRAPGSGFCTHMTRGRELSSPYVILSLLLIFIRFLLEKFCIYKNLNHYDFGQSKKLKVKPMPSPPVCPILSHV